MLGKKILLLLSRTLKTTTMKKIRFILIGALLGVSVSSCTKVSSNDNVEEKQMVVEFDSNTTPIIVEELGMVGKHQVHSLKKDGVEYIVICSQKYDGGATIIKHEPMWHYLLIGILGALGGLVFKICWVCLKRLFPTLNKLDNEKVDR